MVIIFKPIDMRRGCLELEVNLKITASSVPTYRRRKRVKDKDRLYDTKEGVQAVVLIG